MATLPLPPVDLANRVGQTVGRDGSFADYDFVGHVLHDLVVQSLPAGWTWGGKRVLDFGCGAGRTMRHFVAESAEAEVWGCDIDEPSVAWVNAHLNPPFQAFVNAAAPPLPRPDDSFDLIYAFSVFTHITDQWSAWLLEIHRLLAPGGILVASFLGEGMSQAIAGEPWIEERIGMNVLRAHQSWDHGGPMVLMSPWWIREHWGRAFELVQLTDTSDPASQSIVVARPKPVAPTRADLERIDPGEPREIAALQHNVAQLQREVVTVMGDLESRPSAPPLIAELRRTADRVRTRMRG
jgi:SAM-dependent methyltransferase